MRPDSERPLKNAVSIGECKAYTMLARFFRFRDAPEYLGMDRNRFNREVRQFLTEIPIGKQGIAFDRHELDAWADEYKKLSGRPPREVAGSKTIATHRGKDDFERVVATIRKNRNRP